MHEGNAILLIEGRHPSPRGDNLENTSSKNLLKNHWTRKVEIYRTDL
jgi:hypothetical protein